MAETRTAGILSQIHTLFDTGTLGGLTVQELLDRYVSRRDEVAFTALVQRHAPMVLQVCRVALGDAHDAEDASQATFLILARKADSIRCRGSVSSWLFGVARRVAARARLDLMRRRENERRWAETAATANQNQLPLQSWTEIGDELERLPEKYRNPILLCDLEGMTHEQAAVQLRQPARTLRRRLAAGREMLRNRLARRGFSLPAGSPNVALVQAATRRAVPAVWSDATVRVAMRTSAASARVASWVEGVIATMFWTRLKMAVGLGLLLGLAAAGASVFAIDFGGVPKVQRPTSEAPPGPGAQRVTTVDPRQAVDRISDRIRANYAQFRTLRTTLRTTSLDRSVTKREEVTNQLPGGGTVRFVREPSSVRRERILLRGDDLLRESMEEDGQTWSFLGGVWTQYSPKAGMAWLRLPDQMPGLPPLDPRNIASLEQRWLFVDRLRDDRVLEAGPTRTGDGQLRMSVLLEHAFDKEHTERYRCEFDPARNDLPTRIVVFREGDGIGIVLDIAYQEALPGAAWFLQKATEKFFYPELARSPDSDAWRQSMIVETTEELHVNEGIADDAFLVRLPDGTRVSDSVHRSVYKSGGKPAPD
jgi:RNA polymerase sigma factor (sigma-70 family)